MKYKTPWGFFALVLISFIACKKDNNNNANPAILAGTWNLTSSTGSLNSLLTFERNDTLIELTETQSYYSTSQAGSETFSGDSATSSGLFVHAVVSQNNAQYFNGVLNQDTTTTYGYDQGTLNFESGFDLIGQDSIHFDGPGIPLTAGLVPGGTQGAKFIISGDTLTLTTHVYINDSTSPSAVQHLNQTTITTLVRQ